MESNLSFSVIIPFFNREDYLTKSINSVISQTCKNWELILVDDGSTDKSLEVVNTFLDPRISVYSHFPNQGNAFARNIGWKISKSPWIVFLDSDDWLEPEYLEKIEIEIFKYPTVSFFWTGMNYVDDVGNVIQKGLWTPLDNLPSQTFFDQLKIGIGGACVSKGLFKQYGGFNELLRASVDRDLFLRVSQFEKGLGIDFIGINILIGSHSSVRKSYLNQSEAYDYFCYTFSNQIRISQDRFEWWNHKAMWLALYCGKTEKATSYLKAMGFPLKSTLLYFVFHLFPIRFAKYLHKKLA